ncbi:c-type cytochrome [Granulosicoccus sp.]|nr:c-type cytochrome [Granulosicoccus sp.]MDB4223319.1 c-type cytochrome [Granulosicoccus sp.]
MSGATDSGMMKNMVWIVGAVTVLALLIGFIAKMLDKGETGSDDPIMRNALMERIEPVGSVRTSADDLPQASAVMVVASGPKSAEELVNGACAACHAAGVAGAPLLGDDAAWAPRRELGLDALVASVINGKGAMAARGGSTYTDEEITLAVQQIAMFEPTEAAAPAATESTESSAAEAVDAAVTPVVMGQVPEGLTDTIKASVNGVCAGCHIAGVANAPKFGDVEAWQARADKGMAALVASVANGLNVMPPRGASTLTDEELPIAIQYMLSK